MNARTIFHIDMDAFFASIEIVNNPSLRGKPVIVGGRPDQRGVVSTCSYEARAFGVRSAMSLAEAKKRCPHGIFLEGNFSLYRHYSNQVMSIFSSYTSFVEVVSIDEAYLDLTERIESGGAKALAQKIHQEVYQKTKLICSIGIASNKLVANVASSHAKPNGIYEIPAGLEAQFLAPLPIQSLPGIGRKTQLVLNRDGFTKIADLQTSSLDVLIQRYGAWGYHHFLAAKGEDHRPVEWEERSPKSIGAETTFEKDYDDLEFLKEELTELVIKAYRRMRAHKMRTRRISIKLRDSNFKTFTRSHTLITHYSEEKKLLQETLNLFEGSYAGEMPLRLIGVSFELLTDSYWQPTLWEM